MLRLCELSARAVAAIHACMYFPTAHAEVTTHVTRCLIRAYLPDSNGSYDKAAAIAVVQPTMQLLMGTCSLTNDFVQHGQMGFPSCSLA